jgi:hypothetical protein
MGIFLLRSIVDAMTYRRDHDQNVLHLVIVPRAGSVEHRVWEAR